VGYIDDVKWYRLIDTSIDHLIIECNVHFEESPLHAPRVQHAHTLVPPSILDIRDDDSIHSNSNLDLEDYIYGF
jgi:hypothetical protein